MIIEGIHVEKLLVAFLSSNNAQKVIVQYISLLKKHRNYTFAAHSAAFYGFRSMFALFVCNFVAISAPPPPTRPSMQPPSTT
jgi:hypothetical protein